MQENKNVREVKEELKYEEVKKDLLNENTIKEKYGKVYKVEAEIEDIEKTFLFYFKEPHSASVNRYIRNASKKHLQAGIDFAQENVIEEQKEEFKNTIKEYVGISQLVSNKLLGFLGFTDNVTAKKL